MASSCTLNHIQKSKFKPNLVPFQQNDECGHSDIEDEDEAICVSENAAIITDNQVYGSSNTNTNGHNDMDDSQDSCIEVSPGIYMWKEYK